MSNSNKIESVHYALTFLSIVLLFGCFATHLFTGNAALLILDSLAGSCLFGLIFTAYLAWLVWDLSGSNKIPVNQAAKITLKSATAICIYAYIAVFIVLPVIIGLVSK